MADRPTDPNRPKTTPDVTRSADTTPARTTAAGTPTGTARPGDPNRARMSPGVRWALIIVGLIILALLVWWIWAMFADDPVEPEPAPPTVGVVLPLGSV